MNTKFENEILALIPGLGSVSVDLYDRVLDLIWNEREDHFNVAEDLRGDILNLEEAVSELRYGTINLEDTISELRYDLDALEERRGEGIYGCY